jgi:hypothetical protein
MVRALSHDSSLHPFVRDAIEAQREHQSRGVDDLDLLPHPRPQRASQVASVVAKDYRTFAVSLDKKGRQCYIALKVS